MTRAEAKAYRNKIDGVLKKVTTDAEALEYAEIYPGEIIPAKSLSEADFTEVTEAEYQAYLTADEEISDAEALEIITGGADA